MPAEVATPVLLKRPQPVSQALFDRLIQVEDIASLVLFLAGQHDRVCYNEITLSPTWNRIYMACEDVHDPYRA